MELNFPSGIWPEMLTPFKESGAIDYAGLKALTKWYIDQGCSGIVADCQASESFCLNLPERIGIASTVIDVAKGKVPVIVSGHVADDKNLQIEELLQIVALDPSAIILNTNRFANENEDDDTWRRNCAEVIEALPEDMPLGLYECAYPYKRLISDENLKWCAQSGRFYFLHDNSCSLRLIKKRLQIVKNTELKIYNAHSATLLPSLRAGCNGFFGEMGAFQPKLYAWLCKHFKDENAEKLQEFLSKSANLVKHNFPGKAKYYLKEFEKLKINTYSRMHDDLTELNIAEMQTLRDYSQEMRKSFSL
ncbi:MAG: dihydrodipicolinate synthase family protein [Succinatimonas sp.]|nr:dihydrodipicolinate synthase family protein [Succinatimonas sp.]